MAPKTIRGFAAVYTLLAFVAVAALLGAYAFSQTRVLTHKVAVVQKAIGETDYVKVAEATVAASAQQQGLTLTSQKITKVVVDPKDPNKVTVYDSLRTVEAGQIRLVVTLTKGVWTVSNVALAA